MNRNAGFLTFTTLVFAAFTPSEWKFRKAIDLTPGDALATVKLDRDVYTGTRADLADIRVLRDGEEAPYVLETLAAKSEYREKAGEILDEAVVPGLGLRFILKLPDPIRHNRIRFETDEGNFRRSVSIETSRDGKHWSIARDDGAIFDFTQGGKQLSSLTVEYPVSTQPYLRVTIRGWLKPGAIHRALVDDREDRPASRETLATINPQVAEDTNTHSSILTLDTSAAGLPVDRIRISITSPLFHRAAEVERSADGKNWVTLMQGAIARLPGQELLTLPIPETRDRYLRVRIYNRDDRPLEFGAVQLAGIIRKIKFPASAQGHYWLYYGNPNATAATYDLAMILSRRDHVEQAAWAAGPASLNPDYRPPSPPVAPWSERHPAILYTVLGGAVLGLGAATLRFAKGLRTN